MAHRHETGAGPTVGAEERRSRMSKRIVVTAAALLAIAATATPVRATVTNPNINDVYCLTISGQIYRIPNGGSPNLEFTLSNFHGEWFDFDAGSGEFIA